MNKPKGIRAFAFGMNAKGQVGITPQIPSEPEEMGVYIHVDDVGSKEDLFTDAAELLAAAKLALSIAEGHIKSKYEKEEPIGPWSPTVTGVARLLDELTELDPVRTAIKKMEDKKCRS